MDGLLSFLMQNCCRGSGESCAPLATFGKSGSTTEIEP
jgi:hypothetical protein